MDDDTRMPDLNFTPAELAEAAAALSPMAALELERNLLAVRLRNTLQADKTVPEPEPVEA